MRRLLLICAVLAASGLGVSIPNAAGAEAARSLSVSGTQVEMYPAFDPAIDRYAVTTTDLTLGTVDVAPTPGPSETVSVNGGNGTHLTGLSAGDRITVAFSGGASPHTYTLIYLPPGFPKLTVSTGAQGSFPGLEPGLIAVTLFPYGGVPIPPAYDAIVDRNGVPVYAEVVSTLDLLLRHFDLKQQPNGEITIQRPTTALSHTGYATVVLDDQGQFQETARYDVADPLTNTDFHDSVRLPDSSTILMGYEPNLVTGKTDATIQKLDAGGQEVFSWTSAPFAAETTASLAAQGGTGDYAHVNSVVSVEDGDIIVSFRHLSAVYRIATVDHGIYHEGDVIWKLGGRDSDFTFPNDTLGGPCGQHTASQLPNGHILIFDNGTDGLCVNPLDRAGATVSRGFTRVTEYALDTVAGTATLVHFYQPAGKYSLFAGSARRMTNGNTLIGWASDSSALATEVSPSDQKLWELTTPVGAPRYISYRAELITAFEPQVTLTGPADGASFVAGDTVPVSATCLDWRREPLPNCPLAGVTGGVLDTSSAGPHAWQATATDGAGNTTIVARHYTVRLPGRQPDGLIRKGRSATWHGGNVYPGPAGETVRQGIRRTHTRADFWQVQNDGERADVFRLAGAGSNRRFRVHYFAGGVDVTRAVVAGTYLTLTLQPGQSVTIKVTVTPTRRAPVDSTRTVTMAALSVNDAARSDRVATVVVTRR